MWFSRRCACCLLLLSLIFGECLYPLLSMCVCIYDNTQLHSPVLCELGGPVITHHVSFYMSLKNNLHNTWIYWYFANNIFHTQKKSQNHRWRFHFMKHVFVIESRREFTWRFMTHIIVWYDVSHLLKLAHHTPQFTLTHQCSSIEKVVLV